MLYRVRDGVPEVLLGHMGGPVLGPQGRARLVDPQGRVRRRRRRAGRRPPRVRRGDWLGAARRRAAVAGRGAPVGGKRVVAWALEGDLDPATVKSNTFTLEWPPRSGRQQEFPEIDRADWFALDAARAKLVKGQVPLLDALAEKLALR